MPRSRARHGSPSDTWVRTCGRNRTTCACFRRPITRAAAGSRLLIYGPSEAREGLLPDEIAREAKGLKPYQNSQSIGTLEDGLIVLRYIEGAYGPRRRSRRDSARGQTRFVGNLRTLSSPLVGRDRQVQPSLPRRRRRASAIARAAVVSRVDRATARAAWPDAGSLPPRAFRHREPDRHEDRAVAFGRAPELGTDRAVEVSDRQVCVRGGDEEVAGHPRQLLGTGARLGSGCRPRAGHARVAACTAISRRSTGPSSTS